MKRMLLIVTGALVCGAGNCNPNIPLPAAIPLPNVDVNVRVDVPNIPAPDLPDPILGQISVDIGPAVGDAIAQALAGLVDLVEALSEALAEVFAHMEQFPGTRSNIWFSPDRSNRMGIWRPGMPVAVGTPFILDAVAQLGSRAPLPPVRPEVDPASVFRDVTLAPQHFDGVAAEPGIAHVLFRGQVSDTVEVSVRQPVNARMIDPMLYLGELIALGTSPRLTPFWPDVGDDLALAPHTQMLLRPELLDSAERPLYFHALNFELGGDENWVGERWTSVGLVVAARSSVKERGWMTMRHAGKALGRLRLRTVDSAQVTEVHVQVQGNPTQGLYWAYATALLPNGQRLLQAPLEWEFGSGLTGYDLLGAASPDLQRTDLRLIVAQPATTTDTVRTVRVRLRDMRAEASIQLPDPARPASVPALEASQHSSSCRDASLADGLCWPWPAAVAAAVMAWRRKRVHRNGTAGWRAQTP